MKKRAPRRITEGASMQSVSQGSPGARIGASQRWVQLSRAKPAATGAVATNSICRFISGSRVAP